MVSPHCPICIDTHPLEQFRILKCGHAFCLQVLGDLKKQPKPRKVCPVCREKLLGPTDLDGTQVYMSFVSETDNATLAEATAVALDVLQPGIGSEKVERISDSIESSFLSIKDSKESYALQKLRKSLHDFKKRVAPALAELSSLQAQLDQLRHQAATITQERDTQRISLSRLERACASLERNKAENVRVRDEALAAAEAAALETVALRSQVTNFHDKLDRYRTENEALNIQVAKLTEDNRRYRTKAQKFKALEHDYKKQISHLENRLATSHSTEFLGDSSVHCSPEPEDSISLHSPLPPSDFEHLDYEAPASSLPQNGISTSRSSVLFSSDWNLPTTKTTRVGLKRPAPDVLELDPHGRPKKAVATGIRSRVRLGGGLKL